jgi:hypothetical protein
MSKFKWYVVPIFAIFLELPFGFGTSISVFPENSRCNDAIDFSMDAKIVMDMFLNRQFIFTDEHLLSSSKLKGLSFGIGSTGTHAIHNMMHELRFKASHYSVPILMALTHSCFAKKTLEYPNRDVSCSPQSLIEQIWGNTTEAFTLCEFYSDTPMSALYADIMKTFPSLFSVSSFRSMDSFMNTRVHKHNTDVICDEDLWSHPSVLHPFDIVSCLRLGNYSHPRVKLAAEIKNSTAVRIAYKRMNTVNVIIAQWHSAQGNVSTFMPVCLEDYSRNETQRILLQKIAEFVERLVPPDHIL